MQVLQEQREIFLALKGALDINTADEVRRISLEHLKQHNSVVVDLSLVEGCDAAGAQLLIALEKSAESAGKSFRILSTSKPFDCDCADIGIQFASSASPADSPSNPSRDRETKKPRNLAKKKSARKVVEASNE
jgi:anti-anti-sigma factor